MAGRPKRKQDLLRLQEAPELGELIMERLAEGKQLTRICYETGICKAALLEWLDAPEHAEAASRARARAATVLADEMMEIADEIDEDNPGAVNKAKIRVGVRQWVAERWNRGLYGQRPAEVTVNLQMLHLEALRHCEAQQAKLAQSVPSREPAPSLGVEQPPLLQRDASDNDRC